MGIVHHTNHFRYFEEARMELMRNAGADPIELEKLGIIIPNVDAYAKYIRPIHCGELINVNVKPAELTPMKIKFEYKITHDGALCCTGYTTHTFVGEDMKPLVLKRAFPEIAKKLEEIFEACV